LNEFSRYLLYFPEEFPEQLDQDKIIDISDHKKARGHECHEAMVDASIDIFEMSYEKSVSYFKRLENLEKIRCINSTGPATRPVNNKDM
jgi:hypothetical protein